jgi:phosphopantothenoylcysteine decarboxylase/phosphopantothenate--cysteine ligase
MGSALAEKAIELGHHVTVISGPVSVDYPAAAKVVQVVTTDEMLEAAQRLFVESDGLIGAAAPCDYMPHRVSDQKLAKDGKPLELRLVETPDVVASCAREKQPHQWVVGFALETDDRRFRATVKMQKKSCDLMVSNGPAAIDALTNDVEILASDGSTIARAQGDKLEVAGAIMAAVEALISERSSPARTQPSKVRNE